MNPSSPTGSSGRARVPGQGDDYDNGYDSRGYHDGSELGRTGRADVPVSADAPTGRASVPGSDAPTGRAVVSTASASARVPGQAGRAQVRSADGYSDDYGFGEPSE